MADQLSLDQIKRLIQQHGKSDDFLTGVQSAVPPNAPQAKPDLTYSDMAVGSPEYMAQARAAQSAPTQWDLPKPFTALDNLFKEQNAYNPPAGTSILDVLRDAPINKAIAAPFQALAHGISTGFQAPAEAYRGNIPQYDYDPASGRSVPSKSGQDAAWDTTLMAATGGGAAVRAGAELPEQTAGIFAGRLGAEKLAASGEKRPLQALNMAAALKQQGAKPDAIYDATNRLLRGTDFAGVHYGADGLPRFEIADKSAAVRTANPSAPEKYYAIDSPSVQYGMSKAEGFDLPVLSNRVSHDDWIKFTDAIPDPTVRKQFRSNPNIDRQRMVGDAFAGNAEADVVGRRFNLTPEQRRAKAPWLDYTGVPIENVIRKEGESQFDRDWFSSQRASGETKAPTAQKPVEPPPPAQQQQIPDWLKAMAPDAEAISSLQSSRSLPDWLSAMAPAKASIPSRAAVPAQAGDSVAFAGIPNVTALRQSNPASPHYRFNNEASAKAGEGFDHSATSDFLNVKPSNDAFRKSDGTSFYSNASDSAGASSMLQRELDRLGFYSGALEQAKKLPNSAPGQQILSTLRNAGVKQAEIDATGLGKFLESKPGNVSRDDVTRFLTENRVGLNESRYGKAGFNGPAKWSSYSLDSANPSYRETVLSLPSTSDKAGIPRDIEFGGIRNEMNANDFRSGHFPEPNIIGHTMTSMVKHEGRPVYHLDQIQSDWGQKLRDGGVRDEAKIAALQKQARELRGADYLEPNELAKIAEKEPQRWAEIERVSAELSNARNSATDHPLVNTTDQWTQTTLRNALRHAIDSNADHIAIPSGRTVLNYNPGDAHGMAEFYDKIVPKNLGNILDRLDKGGANRRYVEALQSHSGGPLEKSAGHTLFDITPKMREEARKGLPLFANADERAGVAGLAAQDSKAGAVGAYRGIDTSRPSAGVLDSMFASSHPNVAGSYANEFDGFNHGAVMPLQMRFKNPYTVDAKGNRWTDIEHNGSQTTTEHLAKLAREKGHDGLIVDNVIDVNSPREWQSPATSYAALQRGTVFDRFGNQVFSNMSPSLAAALLSMRRE